MNLRLKHFQKLEASMAKRPSAATRAIQNGAFSTKPRNAKANVVKCTTTKMTKSVSVKVASLREAGYENFQTWLEDAQNLYVGRRGRIFIHDPDGSKRIFHFASSKWHNPFAVSKTMSRQMACDKFRSALLDGSLKDHEEDLSVDSFLFRVARGWLDRVQRSNRPGFGTCKLIELSIVDHMTSNDHQFPTPPIGWG
eukprot:Skav213193  [mRNA]  locus=scaffold2826:153190:153777:+ [translate_table: standard]